MSSLFGQVWFWSLLAFLVGAVLTWVLLVRPAQQRVQQLERQPRNGRPTPSTSGQAQPQQIPPRPAQQSPRAPQPPQPAWPGQQQDRDPGNPEHHPRTQWLERDSLEEARRAQAERAQQAERTQQGPEAGRTQQVPEQWSDTTTQRSGVAERPGAAEQRAQPTQFVRRPDQQTPGQAPQAPGQRPDVPDQRAFVPAEPPVPYGQEEDVQRELERQYREEYGHDHPEDDREYAEDVQGYAEDDDRDYQGDAQDYAPEYADDEFTGRVHPSSYADAAPGRQDATGRQDAPGRQDRLDDIDEQPELGGLGDFDAEPEPAQRPGGLFEPSGAAEHDVAYDDGHQTNGYAAAQPSGTVDAPDTAAPDTAAPDTAASAPEEDDDAAPDTDPVTGLPKRRRGASNRIRGGFAPPRPIEPSIRPVARRTPQRDGGSSSGSLFEPGQGEQAGAVAQAGYPQAGGYPQPGGHAETADVPPGPFGPGSAMPLPGGGRPDPSFTVKASVTELRYCAEGSPQFASMTPEVWFATPGDAERVGFRPTP